MYNQLHVDLETLDTEHTARILSIGAVWGGQTFYAQIDTSHYEMYAMPEWRFTYSQKTLDWWDKQGGFQPSVDRVEAPFSAISRFIKWVTDVTADANDWTIWANAPDFDCAILRHHMKIFTLKCPWKYYQQQDVRTVKRLAERLKLPVKKFKNDHNALQDAKNQREYVINVYETLADRLQIANEVPYELKL